MHLLSKIEMAKEAWIEERCERALEDADEPTGYTESDTGAYVLTKYGQKLEDDTREEAEKEWNRCFWLFTEKLEYRQRHHKDESLADTLDAVFDQIAAKDKGWGEEIAEILCELLEEVL